MKTISLNILLCLLFFLGITHPAAAQKKRWEHNLYESVGRVNKFDSHDEQTIAIRLGYGINYYLTEKWSVMSGVALRMKTCGETNEFSGRCSSTYLDFPILTQYHTKGEKDKGFVVECGPVLSFLTHEKKWTGLSWGYKRYKNFDIGIRPGIYYEISHWRFGVQSHIGLLDIKRKYKQESHYNPPILNKYHTFDVTATISVYL